MMKKSLTRSWNSWKDLVNSSKLTEMKEMIYSSEPRRELLYSKVGNVNVSTMQDPYIAKERYAKLVVYRAVNLMKRSLTVEFMNS